MNVNFRNALIAVCLGSATAGAMALALGHARGAVVLGRPVDLAFDVHLDAGKALEDACITADMVSGTSAVASGSVRVTPLPTLPGRAPSVRVQSTFVADEPMLTVTLNVGCTGKISRTYTFLADLPDTVAPTTRPIAIPRSALPAVPADAGAGLPRGAAAVPTARPPAMAVPVLPGTEAQPRPRAARASEAAAPVVAPARAKPVPAAASARKSSRSEALAQPPVPRSRLVVEPLEHWLESPSQLRLTTELALPGTPATPEQRAQAQAEWRALNMGPQELLQENGRMVALNTELSQLRGQAEQERAQVQQLLQRLEKEKSERYSSLVVYLLLALLVLVLTWAAWMASRLRAAAAQAQEAWAGAVAQQSPHPERGDGDDWHVDVPLESGPASLLPADTAPDPMAPPPEPPAPEPQAPVVPALPVAVPVQRRPEPPPVLAQPALMVDPEALFDLQQQAEFFVSVGEHNQAIGVLKKYIADNESTAPAAYLELLRLYRSLSRVDDFNLLRAQFHQHFNAQVPEFAAYNRHGRSLLGYPEVLAGIEAVWSHESVLPLLDSLLFRSADVALERFDLAAYDDLLLINAIARTTPPSLRGEPPPRQRTTPLLAEDGVQDEVLQAPRAKVGPVDCLLDNGDSLLEYDSSWLLGDLGVSKPVAAPVAPAVPVPSPGLGLGIPLDFDLSDPFTSEPVPLPPITESELPPMPVTLGPAPGQAVGFGANSDRFEARHDPEERKKPG